MKKNGKYCNKKSLNMKPLALLLALTLLLGCAIGGTIAWLTSETTDVQNTFTVGDINIELNESEIDNDRNRSYNFVPGDTLPKDPKVTVQPNSEACYLFVKVTVDNNSVANPALSTILHFDIADGWICINSNGNNAAEPAREAFVDDAYYFYKTVDAETAKTGVTYDVLAGKHTDACGTNKTPATACDCGLEHGYVSIDTGVTKEMVSIISGEKPVLLFDAAAVQSDNIGDVTEAIKQVKWGN